MSALDNVVRSLNDAADAAERAGLDRNAVQAARQAARNTQGMGQAASRLADVARSAGASDVVRLCERV